MQSAEERQTQAGPTEAGPAPMADPGSPCRSPERLPQRGHSWGPTLERLSQWASRCVDGLLHKRVLFLTRDAHPALALLLLGRGAQVSITARNARRWARTVPPTRTGEFLAEIRARHPHLDPSPLLAWLAGRPLTELFQAIEPEHHPAQCFDLLLADDVLGRVPDPEQLISAAARLLRPHGRAVFWLDVRDLRHPDDPLSALTLDPAGFAHVFRRSGGRCGNRWMPAALAALLDRQGLQHAEFETEITANEQQLDRLMPRLAHSFPGMQRQSLRSLAGWLVCRRRLAPGTEYPTMDDHPQTLAHSRCRYELVLPEVEGRRVLDLGSGSGLGTALLVRAGASAVVGLERRPEALQRAERDHPLAPPHCYQQHDLEQCLPLADGSFDLVVALEVLEHVQQQQQLVQEIQRVLAPGGVAFISVPHLPFEQFWAERAGEANPYHLHVPDRRAFGELLSGFARVDEYVQLDVVTSVVLPLGDTGCLPSTARVELPALTAPTDRGTLTLTARAQRDGTAAPPRLAPVGHGFGDHQRALGDAMTHNADLDKALSGVQAEAFVLANRLRWDNLANLGRLGAD